MWVRGPSGGNRLPGPDVTLAGLLPRALGAMGRRFLGDCQRAVRQASVLEAHVGRRRLLRSQQVALGNGEDRFVVEAFLELAPGRGYWLYWPAATPGTVSLNPR